jgi:hypothetical protein
LASGCWPHSPHDPLMRTVSFGVPPNASPCRRDGRTAKYLQCKPPSRSALDESSRMSTIAATIRGHVLWPARVGLYDPSRVLVASINYHWHDRLVGEARDPHLVPLGQRGPGHRLDRHAPRGRDPVTGPAHRGQVGPAPGARPGHGRRLRHGHRRPNRLTPRRFPRGRSSDRPSWATCTAGRRRRGSRGRGSRRSGSGRPRAIPSPARCLPHPSPQDSTGVECLDPSRDDED